MSDTPDRPHDLTPEEWATLAELYRYLRLDVCRRDLRERFERNPNPPTATQTTSRWVHRCPDDVEETETVPGELHLLAHRVRKIAIAARRILDELEHPGWIARDRATTTHANGGMTDEEWAAFHALARAEDPT